MGFVPVSESPKEEPTPLSNQETTKTKLNIEDAVIQHTVQEQFQERNNVLPKKSLPKAMAVEDIILTLNTIEDENTLIRTLRSAVEKIHSERTATSKSNLMKSLLEAYFQAKQRAQQLFIDHIVLKHPLESFQALEDTKLQKILFQGLIDRIESQGESAFSNTTIDTLLPTYSFLQDPTSNTFASLLLLECFLHTNSQERKGQILKAFCHKLQDIPGPYVQQAVLSALRNKVLDQNTSEQELSLIFNSLLPLLSHTNKETQNQAAGIFAKYLEMEGSFEPLHRMLKTPFEPYIQKLQDKETRDELYHLYPPMDQEPEPLRR